MRWDIRACGFPFVRLVSGQLVGQAPDQWHC